MTKTDGVDSVEYGWRVRRREGIREYEKKERNGGRKRRKTLGLNSEEGTSGREGGRTCRRSRMGIRSEEKRNMWRENGQEARTTVTKEGGRRG